MFAEWQADAEEEQHADEVRETTVNNGGPENHPAMVHKYRKDLDIDGEKCSLAEVKCCEEGNAAGPK